MKKIQYVKLVGLLTILLFLNISCKDDDTLLRGSGITEQSWSTNRSTTFCKELRAFSYPVANNFDNPSR